ncbi:pre-mRNA-processing protein Prp40p [[Candida] jaroonii]|uniref:Pre-mRNA-processing protein Prp40p n=1 Tax=[Candida] jaroonii TaxID=467808 RepID=A0ACA9Y6F4_9ASCO|nr:pre-mRNA-processing protein Prp40p [[Candida] jaroonii]
MAWQKVNDDEGNVYYYNPETQETSWTNPDESSVGEWQEFTTDDGQKYYYNTKTQETTWDKPEGFESSTTTEEGEMSKETKAVEKLPSDKEDSVPIEDSVESEIKVEEISSEEATKNFRGLLSENGVDSTWSFPQVIAKFINNPIYWQVKDPLERKQIYDEYLNNEMNKQLENKTESFEKFKVNFINILQSLKEKKEFDHLTKWFTIKNKLLKEENPIFTHTILSDDEIYGIFKEYQDEIRANYEKDTRESKNQALKELESYLVDINPGIISGTDDWESLYTKLINDNRFKANKHFNILGKHDILQLYYDKIYPKELSNLESELKSLEDENYTSDRRARDNFKKLLSELPIEADMEFEEILPLIEDEDAYIDLCGRNGSTPLDLFHDVKMAKVQVLKIKVDLIESIVDDKNIDREKVLSSELAFVESMKGVEDDRLKGVNLDPELPENDVTAVFESLVKNEVSRKEKQVEQLKVKLNVLKKDLSSWLVRNYQTLDVFENSDETEVTKDSIVITSSNGNYSMKYDPEVLDRLQKSLENIPEFKNIHHTIQEIKMFQEIDINEILIDILNEFINRLNNNTKRTANFDESTTKRLHTDDTVKPKKMIINY